MTKEKTAGFDLAELDTVKASEEGAELELLHPLSGKGLGIFLRLTGMDGGTYRTAKHAISNRRLKRGRVPTAEMIDREGVELLAKCTLGWSGVVENGKVIEFSRAAACSLYERFPWIADQADSFIADRGNYLKN